MAWALRRRVTSDESIYLCPLFSGVESQERRRGGGVDGGAVIAATVATVATALAVGGLAGLEAVYEVVRLRWTAC